MGLSKRVRPILAEQATASHLIQDGLEYLDAIHGPRSRYLDGIANAPYLHLGPYQ